MEDFISQTERFALLIWQFWIANTLLITIIAITTLVLWVFRRWPDRAAQTFLAAGIRVPSKKIQEHRDDLAEIVANAGAHGLRALTQQQQRIETLRQEREKVAKLIQVNPKLVKEVGRALEEIEREYFTHLQSVKSLQAREALRITTEKSINDVLQSVTENKHSLPAFSLDTLTEKSDE